MIEGGLSPCTPLRHLVSGTHLPTPTLGHVVKHGKGNTCSGVSSSCGGQAANSSEATLASSQQACTRFPANPLRLAGNPITISVEAVHILIDNSEVACRDL